MYVYITVMCGSLSRWFGLYSFNYVCKLCYERITRLFYVIYSGQKYKNEDDSIIMIMETGNPIE